MKIKILGAGVARLATAVALKQKDFEVEVYERHKSRSHLGAGIVCWPNASFVLDKLGIIDDISNQSGQPVRMRRLTKDGDDLGVLDILKLNKKMNYSSFSILRKDLMKILESHLNQWGLTLSTGKQSKN